MTRINISPSILEYRRSMASAVEYVHWAYPNLELRPCDEGVTAESRRDLIASDPSYTGLLKSPRFESLDADIIFHESPFEVLVQAWTLVEYGARGVLMNISDERGTLIERGYALQNAEFPDHWVYILMREAAEWPSLTIQAIVTDRLGGMGMQTLTVPLRGTP